MVTGKGAGQMKSFFSRWEEAIYMFEAGCTEPEEKPECIRWKEGINIGSIVLSRDWFRDGLVVHFWAMRWEGRSA